MMQLTSPWQYSQTARKSSCFRWTAFWRRKNGSRECLASNRSRDQSSRSSGVPIRRSRAANTNYLNKKISKLVRFILGLVILNIPPITYLTIVGPKIAPLYVAVIFLIINIAFLIKHILCYVLMKSGLTIIFLQTFKINF